MTQEGYRYIRQYRTRSGDRWALWQVVNGKSKRVGTALTVYHYLAFLFRGPVPLKYLETFTDY